MKYIFSLILLIFSTVTYAKQANEKLIFALDLIRHGDRTPLVSYPGLPYSWPEGKGQLTKEGIQQEYELGQKLRQRYIIDTKLLSPELDVQSIYVRSTDYDRTLMSAQAVLSGLYAKCQPIPVHSFPEGMDSVLVPDRDAVHYQKVMKKYVYSQRAYQQKLTELKPLLSRLSQTLGAPVTQASQLIALGDLFYIYQVHHIPLPKELSKEDIEETIAAGRWFFVNAYSSLSVGRAFSGRLTASITDYLVKAATHQSRLKWVLFSAHDISIATVASALGIPLQIWPPYASDMSFSLYERSNHEYIVKVSINNELQKIPGCAVDGCTLAQFKAAALANDA